jgi:hypothetical protein
MTFRPSFILSMAVTRPQPIQERRHVFNPAADAYQLHTPTERFVRTIPFDWLARCTRLPGKATSIALGLWFLSGVRKSTTFRLTAEAVHLAGCSRSALYRGLSALENAGLIVVARRPGARPLITINKQPLPPLPEAENRGESASHSFLID